MLNHQTMEKLHALRLIGMAEAYRQQMEDTQTAGLSFEERFGMLVDQHWTWRENQAMARRLKKSKLDAEPCVEDIDFRHPRGLDRPLIRTLITSQWVAQHLSALFTGPTGIGKSWLAQALAQKACRDGYTVLYRPAPKLFRDLMTARGDGSLGRVLETIARTDVLVGAPKAITAMARKLACLFYRLIKHGQQYVDKGTEYYEVRYREQQIRSLAKRMQKLGLQLVIPKDCVNRPCKVSGKLGRLKGGRSKSLGVALKRAYSITSKLSVCSIRALLLADVMTDLVLW